MALIYPKRRKKNKRKEEKKKQLKPLRKMAY
jgi:hypothetical protein